MESPESIREFWFGNGADDAAVAAAMAPLWWAKDDAVDAQMRQRFADTLAMAASGALAEWAATPQGCLALILLTDQFPRNMYRGTALAFAHDAQARAVCRNVVAHGVDRQLRPIERVFCYLPLEHSESPDDQDLCVALFERLRQEVPVAQREVFEGFYDYAVRHQVIIARFGRYPHRNAILGRTSTAAEIAFLQEPDSSF